MTFLCCISGLVDAPFMECQGFTDQEGSFSDKQPDATLWNQFQQTQLQQSQTHPYRESMLNSKLTISIPKTYQAPQSAITHRRKQHHCSICGRSCQSQADLIKHMRVHTGERPFKCQTCGKGFSQTYNLNRHVATSHRQWILQAVIADNGLSCAFGIPVTYSWVWIFHLYSQMPLYTSRGHLE